VQAVAGQEFTAQLDETAIPDIGARVEVPQTREIVSFWRPATSEDGTTWSVTLDSPPEPGDYVLVWRSGAPDGTQSYAPMGPFPDPTYEIFVPLFTLDASWAGSGGSGGVGGGGSPLFPTIDRGQVTPTADDVAALERTRIVDQGGGDPGTFTDATHPTVTEVEKLISIAIEDVLVLLPDSMDVANYGSIRQAVTLYAATLVEASYFREKLDQGSVELYRELFQSTVRALNLRNEGDVRSASLAIHAGGALS
jgi:hypothetical protein